jgi:hypothetical protein
MIRSRYSSDGSHAPRQENHVAYLQEDIAHFVRGAPYLALSRPQSASRFLARQLTLLDECFTTLEAYPEVKVEPLEFFYLTGRSLGMLDADSLASMVTTATWRGVVWGGWLALMRPRPEFAAVLASAAAHAPDNLWPIRCALALVEGRSPPAELVELSELAGRVRDALRTLRIARTPLRRDPTDEERSVLEQERSMVRAAYERHGADGALQVLRGTRLYAHTMPYARWWALHGRTKA